MAGAVPPGLPGPAGPGPLLGRPAPRTGPDEKHQPRFHGDGLTLLGVLIVNALLTLVTVGFYHFWGKVKVRQFFLGQTELGGDRFAFHGTGLELLLGWLKVMAVFALAGVFFAVVIPGLHLGPRGMLAAGLCIDLMMLVLVPIAMVLARRYWLSRTSWRGVRFSFRGRWQDFIGPFVKGVLLCMVTLGFYTPYFLHQMYSFFTNQSYYGNQRFHYEGSGQDLMMPYVKAFFLCLVTLGLYAPWWYAEQRRYFLSRTRFGAVRFESTVTGGGMLVLGLTNVLLAIVTMGLGVAWVLVRTWRFHCENVVLHGSLDVRGVKQDLQAASAAGEELAGALDVGAGFGGIGL